MIRDYDEFNIYTTVEDIEKYAENLLNRGIELKDDIYNLCLIHFGEECRKLIERLFEEE